MPHKVVIKSFKKGKLLSRPDLQQKLKQEWDIHTSLEHPNVISAYLATEDDISVGLFMEYAGARVCDCVVCVLLWVLCVIRNPTVISGHLATEDDVSGGLFMEFAGVVLQHMRVP